MNRFKPFLLAGLPLAIGGAVFAVPAIAADDPLTPYEQSLACKFSQTCDPQLAQGNVGAAEAVDQGIEVGDEAPFNVFTSPKPSPSKPTTRKVQTARSGVGEPQLYVPPRSGMSASGPRRRIALRPKPSQSSPVPMRKNAADMSVFFDNASADLDAASRKEIIAWANVLKSSGFMSSAIRIEGHTNAVGGREYNLELSQRRAQAVKEYLINLGVDSSRIESVGFGFDKPRSGDARDTINRRVEIVKTN